MIFYIRGLGAASDSFWAPIITNKEVVKTCKTEAANIIFHHTEFDWLIIEIARNRPCRSLAPRAFDQLRQCVRQNKSTFLSSWLSLSRLSGLVWICGCSSLKELFVKEHLGLALYCHLGLKMNSQRFESEEKQSRLIKNNKAKRKMTHWRQLHTFIAYHLLVWNGEKMNTSEHHIWLVSEIILHSKIYIFIYTIYKIEG